MSGIRPLAMPTSASRAAAPAAASDVLRWSLAAGVGEAADFSYSCMETAPNETRLFSSDLRGTLRFGVFSFSTVARFMVPAALSFERTDLPKRQVIV